MSIFNRLKEALSKTSNKISSNIDHIFFKKKLDDTSLEELEELLIASDISVQVAANIIRDLRILKFDKEVEPDEIKLTLADLIAKILEEPSKSFVINEDSLNIILVCGVNGNGKTTTIGKLAAKFIAQGKKVGVAACDTFRAAATEQLSILAARSGARLFTGEAMQDAASVAYLAVNEAKKDGLDILFIDTAGRLHNHKNLMEELGKIVRVIQKIEPNAPHHSLLVIDSTTGQNANTQVEQFSNIAKIDGLIITKLDGSAKAGVIVGIVQKFAMPVYFIGIGEGQGDIKPFHPGSFAKALVGAK
jgi:fused signal recognition particle receptor